MHSASTTSVGRSSLLWHQRNVQPREGLHMKLMSSPYMSQPSASGRPDSFSGTDNSCMTAQMAEQHERKQFRSV